MQRVAIFIALSAITGCGDSDDFPDTMGAPSSSSDPMGPTAAEMLGAPCTTDEDCEAPGLTCLSNVSNEFLGGGPSGGLCTARCSASGDATCTDIDATAVCVDATAEGAEPRGFCVPGCSPGAPAEKCLGRSDLACVATNDGSGFCQPACTSDEDCGRACDLASGVCVDAIEAERMLPIGAPCDPAADACLGTCTDVGGNVYACSGGCALASAGCGAAIYSPPPYDAFCLLPADGGGAAGDLGLCVGLCDCDDDCENPGMRCEDAGEAAIAVTGHRGFCVAEAVATVSLACDASSAP